MFDKTEILIILLALFIAFYLVIWWGAGGKTKKSHSPEIKDYLFGVRILIIFITVVSLILWLFL